MSSPQLAHAPHPSPTPTASHTCRSLHINELQSLPPEMGNLVGLEAMSLHSNALGELPPQLSRLTNVCRLSLYQNRLRNLPPEIGGLVGLQVREAFRGAALRCSCAAWSSSTLTPCASLPEPMAFSRHTRHAHLRTPLESGA